MAKVILNLVCYSSRRGNILSCGILEDVQMCLFLYHSDVHTLTRIENKNWGLAEH